MVVVIEWQEHSRRYSTGLCDDTDAGRIESCASVGGDGFPHASRFGGNSFPATQYVSALVRHHLPRRYLLWLVRTLLQRADESTGPARAHRSPCKSRTDKSCL